MTPEELCKLYPHLDVMLAETLLKASEAGKLQSLLDNLPEEPTSTEQILRGAITIEEPQEKSVPCTKEECEATFRS